jgi:hypothetical protein
MKKFKLRSVVIILFILMGIQFLVGLADFLWFKAHNEYLAITSSLMKIFSFPISIINKDLPFYVSDDLFNVISYWLLNASLQALVIYVILKVIKRLVSFK